jgi:starch synthase
LKTRVLHLTAELWPYARTGGLGQAVAGLADYQAASGTESHVVLPLYREARAHAGRLKPFCDPFTVESGKRREEVRVWRQVGDKFPKTLFLEHDPSFDRPGLYGDSGGDYPDNPRRFALFASASIEIARRIGEGNLILHAHDWHAALVPVFLRRVYRDEPDLQRLPAVLTVHNGGFQGVYPYEVLHQIGLPQDMWSRFHGVVRPAQFSEGRAALRRHGDHGQSDARSRAADRCGRLRAAAQLPRVG